MKGPVDYPFRDASVPPRRVAFLILRGMGGNRALAEARGLGCAYSHKSASCAEWHGSPSEAQITQPGMVVRPPAEQASGYLRSDSLIGRSLMQANLRSIRPFWSNCQFSFPYERNQLAPRNHRATGPRTAAAMRLPRRPASFLDQPVVQLPCHLRVRKATIAAIPGRIRRGSAISSPAGTKATPSRGHVSCQPSSASRTFNAAASRVNGGTG